MTLFPGYVVFDPELPGRRRATVRVRSVTRWYERQPRGAKAWAVDPRARIVEVDTGTATIEWAVLGEHLRSALAEVRAITPVVDRPGRRAPTGWCGPDPVPQKRVGAGDA